MCDCFSFGVFFSLFFLFLTGLEFRLNSQHVQVYNNIWKLIILYPIDLKIIFGISLLQPGPPKYVFLAMPLDTLFIQSNNQTTTSLVVLPLCFWPKKKKKQSLLSVRHFMNFFKIFYVWFVYLRFHWIYCGAVEKCWILFLCF